MRELRLTCFKFKALFFNNKSTFEYFFIFFSTPGQKIENSENVLFF
jgi:hypothetical protein